MKVKFLALSFLAVSACASSPNQHPATLTLRPVDDQIPGVVSQFSPADVGQQIYARRAVGNVSDLVQGVNILQSVTCVKTIDSPMAFSAMLPGIGGGGYLPNHFYTDVWRSVADRISNESSLSAAIVEYNSLRAEMSEDQAKSALVDDFTFCIEKVSGLIDKNRALVEGIL